MPKCLRGALSFPEPSQLQSRPAALKAHLSRSYFNTGIINISWELVFMSWLHHSGNPVPAQHTHSQLEVIEGVLVDGFQLGHQRQGEVHHGADVQVLPVGLLRERRHV